MSSACPASSTSAWRPWASPLRANARANASPFSDDATITQECASNGTSAAKIITRHLLSTGTDLLHVVNEASRALARRRAFASMVVVRLDKTSGTITYVNAGHPPPIVYGPEPHALDDRCGPWLGMNDASYREARAQRPPGCAFLMYTDGLVEQRGVAIDDSIAELIRRPVRTDDARAAISELIQSRTARREVPDDIAAVLVRRPAPA